MSDQPSGPGQGDPFLGVRPCRLPQWLLLCLQFPTSFPGLGRATPCGVRPRRLSGIRLFAFLFSAISRVPFQAEGGAAVGSLPSEAIRPWLFFCPRSRPSGSPGTAASWYAWDSGHSWERLVALLGGILRFLRRHGPRVTPQFCKIDRTVCR